MPRGAAPRVSRLCELRRPGTGMPAFPAGWGLSGPRGPSQVAWAPRPSQTLSCCFEPFLPVLSPSASSRECDEVGAGAPVVGAGVVSLLPPALGAPLASARHTGGHRAGVTALSAVCGRRPHEARAQPHHSTPGGLVRSGGAPPQTHVLVFLLGLLSFPNPYCFSRWLEDSAFRPIVVALHLPSWGTVTTATRQLSDTLFLKSPKSPRHRNLRLHPRGRGQVCPRPSLSPFHRPLLFKGNVVTAHGWTGQERSESQAATRQAGGGDYSNEAPDGVGKPVCGT